jgi:hypothetical protein
MTKPEPREERAMAVSFIGFMLWLVFLGFILGMAFGCAHYQVRTEPDPLLCAQPPSNETLACGEVV